MKGRPEWKEHLTKLAMKRKARNKAAKKARRARRRAS